ncbi:MAG TPA: phosphopantetheine-binding protein [Candidatus Acidoferrales bacterium]|jgi:acyl carrier protein|nr:phosphopantetheine-binding protein [Candidatus Acidoferrales bacterium]
MNHEPTENSGTFGRVAPRTPTEKSVAEIWSAALGIREIGIDDNFVELGGDSLSATLFLNRVSHDFQVDLPFEMLFAETMTLAKLAGVIDAMRSQQEGPDV